MTYVDCTVLNPYFASSIDSWTQYTATVSWSAAEGHTAVGALSIDVGGGAATQSITIPAATNWVRLRFWAKGTVGGELDYTFGNVSTAPVIVVPITSGEWTSYEHEFPYLADGTVIFFNADAWNEAIYIDDVSVLASNDPLSDEDWTKSPHVDPSAGTRRLLHPLHESRFRH